MSYPASRGSYEITVTKEPFGGITTSLRVDDLSGLPGAIRALAKQGHNLTATAEALREVEEEQRKERRRNDLRALIELNKEFAQKNRRFLIAFDNDGHGMVDEGIKFRGEDGSVQVRLQGTDKVICYESLEEMRRNYETNNDLVIIEFLD